MRSNPALTLNSSYGFPLEEWVEPWEEDGIEAAPDPYVTYAEEPYWEDYGERWAAPRQVSQQQVMFVAVGLIVIMMFVLVLVFVHIPARARTVTTQTAVSSNATASQTNTTTTSRPTAPGDPLTFVAPYDSYSVTQGIHGQSYGHMAIDIAAGRGTPVKSPINGEVTDLYIDQYNNTTLVIENENYIVTMLHGDFSAVVGDSVEAGQQVGTEGNNGYTMDMAGNLCYGRPTCGNHTHLNVYDKRISANINPLELLR